MRTFPVGSGTREGIGYLLIQLGTNGDGKSARFEPGARLSQGAFGEQGANHGIERGELRAHLLQRIFHHVRSGQARQLFQPEDFRARALAELVLRR